MLETLRGWLGRGAPTLLLFAFGLALCLYHGRQGFMPLDHSIVFDGGWRWLSGQLPFRDYVAPNGFVPHAMQAVFFALFGVSWLSYCLHAAIVNGLFAVVVQQTLRTVGLSAVPSFAYGALSAVVLYPPIGVPFMDPHAFFFSGLAVWTALAGCRAERAGPRRWPWLALPGWLALAVLSKQIPSIFVLPIALGIALLDRAARRHRLRWLSAGAAAVLLLLAVGVLAAGADPALIATYAWRLPTEEAERRLAEIPDVAAFVGMLWREPARLGLASIVVVHVAGLAFLALALRAGISGGPDGGAAPRQSEAAWAAIGAAVLAEALLLACLVFIVLTRNQPGQGVAYLFLAVGLVHASLERAGGLLAARPTAARLLRGAGLAVLLIALRDGVHFERNVNVPRSANDITWDPEQAERAAPQVPAPLSFLRWQTSRFVQFAAGDLRDLSEFLKAQGGGFLLIGDASVAYALAGAPSATPSLWFHPGLTLPLPGDEGFAEYEQRLLERVQDVRFLVLEGRHTWNHLSVADFPRLAPLARQRPGAVTRFGGFTVIDLRDRPIL
jgi:hypothetical protein